MERILELRRRAMEAGFTDNNGSRHSNAFVETIAHSGRLDETRVAVRSLHGFDELLEWAGVGVKSFLRGKAPLRHKSIPGALPVRAIFRRAMAPRENEGGGARAHGSAGASAPGRDAGRAHDQPGSTGGSTS